MIIVRKLIFSIALHFYSLKTIVFYFRALAGGKELDPGLSKNVAVRQMLQMDLRVRIIQAIRYLTFEFSLVSK